MKFNSDSIIDKIINIGIGHGLPTPKTLHGVRINDNDTEEAQQWCEDRFGNNWIWASDIHSCNYVIFYFINPEDALLFKLTFNII
jgi:hypothetical protein